MKIALLTSGGIAPCLSAALGHLILTYTREVPEADIIGYLHGYKGLLEGKSLTITTAVRQEASRLYEFGGSPLGNSRVKLTNAEDCRRRGYIKADEEPLEVAARQLQRDNVTILHTLGGDDTNTMAAALSAYLKQHHYDLTVVGLPKTVDNDVYPIRQSLGAWTAAEQSALFFENVVNENTTSFRQLIVHEVMGRNCGWLTAAAARDYRRLLSNKKFLPDILVTRDRWDLDAVYLPEMEIDLASEADRLRKRMDEKDCVNIFLSEGAGVGSIVKELESKGETVPRDAFGHVRLDEINPGQWFGRQFAKMLRAEKVLVQKSGYFARSAKANPRDLELIQQTADLAVTEALKGHSGVVGLDEEQGDKLCLIDFKRIRGGKPFDLNTDWFKTLLKNIGQKL
ncbi:MAG: pyrophosphate--fructose-6-phosphate 1-phosphotransferase [FCB group bacterium]|nr:pyrophosphate--fructose-6-phosphate 1-phosphotransferase [FCB group bacterium]